LGEFLNFSSWLVFVSQENMLSDMYMADVTAGKDMQGIPWEGLGQDALQEGSVPKVGLGLGQDALQEGSVPKYEDEELQELSEPQLCPG
jgi:hypothetical protein